MNTSLPPVGPYETFSRRDWLFRFANGFGMLALTGLLGCSQQPRFDKRRRVKAKSVIFLYMDGGPSHIDTFDPKPRLTRDDGKQFTQPANLRFATRTLMKSPFRFGKHGQAGIDISEIFPYLARCADELAVVRSMVAESLEHPTGNQFMLTGSRLRGRPSIGSWIAYGLADGREDLPSYVVLNDRDVPQGGMDMLANGFLPTKYQCSIISSAFEHEYLKPKEETPELQRSKLRAIADLNRLSIGQAPSTSALDAVVQNYETAFRLQGSLHEVLNLSSESQAMHALYGLDHPHTERFGRKCLLARRLVERGVRCVLLLPPGVQNSDRWDHHANLANDLAANARAVDRPIAGLLEDLRARGLLDETVVLWGGEFGRTPTAELRPGNGPGREHNPHGFTMWLAGGGVKGGTIYGSTDEYGFRAVENPVTVHDLHATILHLLGIDHTALTFRYGGRDFRLTDVFGRVVHELLA